MPLTAQNTERSRDVARDDAAPSPSDAAALGAPSAEKRAATTETAEASQGPPGSGSPIRFWLGVAAGTLLVLPFGWILSYAAALPFFVGLFFFALLGLIVGATAFRVAKGGAPYGRFTVLAGTTVIVLTGWLTTIIKEGRDFPHDMAKLAAERTLDLGDRSLPEFHRAVAGEISKFLTAHYAPGGTLGYVQWVLAGGEIRKGTLTVVNQTLRAPQQGIVWVIRVVLSVGLLAFGVGSQTLLLGPRARKNPLPAA